MADLADMKPGAYPGLDLNKLLQLIQGLDVQSTGQWQPRVNGTVNLLQTPYGDIQAQGQYQIPRTQAPPDWGLLLGYRKTW